MLQILEHLSQSTMAVFYGQSSSTTFFGTINYEQQIHLQTQKTEQNTTMTNG